MSVRTRWLRGGVVAAVVASMIGGTPAVAGDEAGSANTCLAANTSPAEWSERYGSVHNSGDLTDWYVHSTPANQRTITLDFSNDNVDLQVWPADCSTPPLCSSSTPTWDQCTVTVSGPVKIRIVYPTPSLGRGVSNYVLRVTVPPQCRDGYDNDGDNLTDYPLDPGCTDPTDPTEAAPAPPACGDQVDNDGDGLADYPLDPGCSSAGDTTEENAAGACNPTAPGVVACLTPGTVFLSQPVGVVAPQPTTGHRVVGHVTLYAFPLPVGGEVVLPCVVLTVDSTADACAAAGGEPGDRLATLVDTTVYEQTVTTGAPLTTVRVCHASLTATVLGIGANQIPAYTVC